MASSDGYPYHKIPYSGVKGVGGTPEKDLTIRVVSNLKLERGEFSYVYEDVFGLHCVRWNDYSVLTTLSNCIGPYPLDRVEQFSRNLKKNKKNGSLWEDQTWSKYIIVLWVVLISLIQQLAHITQKSRGKSGGGPISQIHLAFLMGIAWNIYCVINLDTDQSLLAFIISVVQSYLHVD